LAQLRISLIGPFQVVRDGKPVVSFDTNKVRALLAYLATENDRPHLRETLAGLLWPDFTKSSAITNLRSSIAKLRLAIGDREVFPPFLIIDRETIRFNPASTIWVDVQAFEAQLGKGTKESKPAKLQHPHLPQAQSPKINQLKSAIDLCRGPFLEGFFCDSPVFEEWALARRERIHRQLLDALLQLSTYSAESNDFDQSIQYAQRLLELEPWDESAHRLVMQGLARRGQRSTALVQYETCRRLLKQELGVEPSPETQAVYESIRTNALGPLPSPAVRADEAPSPALARLDAILYEKPENRNRPERLFGRQEMVEQVNLLLDQGKQVLLSGMAGAGKTALAATISDQRIQAGEGPYIWLKPVDENIEAIYDALLRRFAGEQERQEIALKTGDARVIAIRNLLARSGAQLWVLDDVWNGAALYRALKVVPDGMAVLATSRFTFNLENMFEVGELSLPEGLNLLAHHAGVDNYRQVPEAQELCLNLGNHAYALEIAGAHLRTYKISPAELLEEIADAPHDLSMPMGYAEQGRESVKLLLDASYNALKDETAHQVFQAFGAFYASSATLDLLATFLKMDARAVRKGLNQLVELSMATRLTDTQYYEIHHLTFSYARMLYREEGQDGAGPVAAIRDFVEAHQQDYDLLALEIENILGAARQAQSQDMEAFIAIIACLATGGYMDSHGHPLGFLKLLDDTIQAVREGGKAQQECLHYLLGKRGNAHFDRGELQPAFEAYQEALILAPNSTRQVILMAVIGKVLSKQGNYPEARDYLDRSYAQAEAAGDAVGMLRILEQYTHAASFHQDFQTIRDLAVRGIELCQQIGDRTREVVLKINLGSVAYDQGVRTSLANHLEAKVIAEELHDTALLADTEYVLGVDYHALEDRDQAQQHLSQALKLFGEVGFKEKENVTRTLMKKFSYRTQEG
jgi:DNA-binding SARP family transcriptional activator/energy-coupling factor transporter ATP-binding protein EcfA2